MPTRNVVLTDHQAALVEQREAEDALRLEALRVAVRIGAADIAAGRFKSFDTKASLRDHLESLGWGIPRISAHGCMSGHDPELGRPGDRPYMIF
jgi:antitoxin ParD1/3/4